MKIQRESEAEVAHVSIILENNLSHFLYPPISHSINTSLLHPAHFSGAV